MEEEESESVSSILLAQQMEQNTLQFIKQCPFNLP